MMWPSRGTEDSRTDSLARALRHTWYALIRGGWRSERLEGIHRQGFWVLGSLACGPLRMSEVAERVEISSASLTGIVDRLEQRGLVERERSDSDRRVVTVALTDDGREVLDAAHADFSRRLDEMLEPLSDAERDSLLRLLTKMTTEKVTTEKVTTEKGPQGLDATS